MFISSTIFFKKKEHSVSCFYVERAVHVHLEILPAIVGRGKLQVAMLQLLNFNC